MFRLILLLLLFLIVPSLVAENNFLISKVFAASETKPGKKSISPKKTPEKRDEKEPLPSKEPQKIPPQSVTLTLADSIFLGMRNNRTIKSVYIDRIAQKFDLRVAEDMFTPQFRIDGDIARQKMAGVVSSIGNISPKASLLIPTGAVFDFAWINAAEKTRQDRVRETAFEARMTQPLLRGGGVEVTMAPLRTSRLSERINQLRLKQTVLETIGQIVFAHRTLLQVQEERKLVKTALERAEDLLVVNRALIRAGRMAEMEIVQAEADLENRKILLLETDNALETARLNLLSLLALDLKTPIIASEDVKPSQKPVDIKKLLPIAFAQRPDYQAQFLIVEQQKLGVVVAKNEQLWDISAFARSRSGRELYDGTFSNRNNQSDVTVGLSFSIPLNDLKREQSFIGASTSLRTAELQLETIREGVESQIRSIVTQVEIRWRQLELARRSQDFAAQAVSIEKEKLKAGRSSNFQVRSLETDLRSAENQYLNAVIGYLNSLTLLDLQLGTALDTWQISLRD